MGQGTHIQWSDHTWNIAVGCSKVDADCKYCYMYRNSLDSKRYNPLEIKRTKTVFNLPLKIKEPSKIFTCSLTDFFHEEIDGYRNEAWDIIRKCPQHIFQILTKRPERIIDCLPADWGEGWDNVWLGTSVGNGTPQGYQRIKDLLKVVAKTRFLSIEPLYGEVDLAKYLYTDCYCSIYPEIGVAGYYDRNTPIIDADCKIHDISGKVGIHQVIVGGESGNENGKYKYRPCKLSWIESIVNQCKDADVPVFVKQMGTYLSKELKMKDRHGGDIEEFPQHLQIREFPRTK